MAMYALARLRQGLRQERGSLPLALLLVIIIGGLGTVIVATTITGQRSVRFDRDFTEVVHSADAGVQDALVRLNAGVLADGDTFTATIDGVPYNVSADELGVHEWELTSTASLNGVQRSVVASTKEVPLWSYALFARSGVAFNGANSTDSYNATDGWCTGNGVVGTDGSLEFSGLASTISCHAANKKITVDGAILYDCGAMDAAACKASMVDGKVRCVHTGGDNCTIVEVEPDPFRLTPEAELQRVVDETAACEAAGWNDTHAGVTQTAGGVWISDNGDTIDARPLASGRDYYCVKSLLFRGNTTINRGADGAPVRIHVRDSVTVEGTKTTVNCPGCTHTDYQLTTPDAAGLQVISTGASLFTLSDPQIQYAAATYVPNAVCEGPAGADIYGSLVCQRVDNVGNWNFHYDDRLGDAGGTGIFAIDRYREEG